MDFRSAILSGIDRLQAQCKPVTAETVRNTMRAWYACPNPPRISRELTAMAKAGLVVYDRKASGWRRA